MKKQVEFPLESIQLTTLKGQTLRIRIIETRLIGVPPKREYYVHYKIHDRRLDEWIPVSKISSWEETDPATQKHVLEQEDTRSKELVLTRNMKRKFESVQEEPPQSENEREELTKVRTIEKVYLGSFSLRTWYFSQYPDEFHHLDVLYVCEFCFKYMKQAETWEHHKNVCKHKSPPGRIVYSHGPHKIYEMDGKDHKLYCQNLCLFSKLFLDHKTVYYDLDSFKFYVITLSERKRNRDLEHALGYFSKEKESVENYNLSCILVFPQHQKKGIGRYELSKLENKIASPERPLSDLGLVGYRSYWQSSLLDILHHNPNVQLTIRELSLLTSISQEDILFTLSGMDMIRFWKGEHIICITPSTIDSFITSHGIKLTKTIDPKAIVLKS